MKIRGLKVKNKILIYILPIILIALSLIIFLAYSSAKKITMNEYNNQKVQITANVINTVNLIDSGYKMLEKSMEDEMVEGMTEFKNAFENAGGDASKVSLDDIKKQMDYKYDLIVIDSETTIIKSTVPEALLFNFMEFDPNLGGEINQIRLSGKIRHESIRTNVGTGFLSKFTYLSTDDHKYLLEISFSKGGLSSVIGDLDPLKVTSQLVKDNPMVSSIKIYDVYGYQFVNSGYNYTPTKKSMEMVARVKKEKSFEVTLGNKIKSYFFIDLNDDKTAMSDNSKIVEIVFDDTILMKTINKMTYYTFTIGIAFIAIIILLIFFLSKKITDPITRLSATAKKVAEGEYEVIADKTSRDEIGELSDVFNTMLHRIREDFKKIGIQKAELEDYSKNLEMMVEDRTIELLGALEESKKTQKLNRESEGFAIHEIICDESGNPVDYRFIDANKAFENFTNCKIAEIRNKTVMETNPETTKDWIQICGHVALTREPYYIDKFSDQGGKHFSINLFSPAEGKFAALFSDITSQIISEEEMKREKNILERILDDILSGYWDWDFTNNTEYLSPGFKKMLGYEDHELPNVPETWQRMIFAEDLIKVNECFHNHVKSLGELPFYNEVRYTHRDGSTIWVICAGHVVTWDSDNQPLQMVGCHINITEIKRLEKSLEEERELLKATLLSMGDGVITTDKTGRVQIVNAVAEELTGWTQEEAFGKPFEEIFHITDDITKKNCENPIEKVFETGETVKLGNHTILISKNGLEMPIEDSVAPIIDDNGNINGAVIIFRDFTERREKQNKIEFLNLHDQLTGLYNRRYLEEELKRLDIANNLPLTLIMLDVNGLKLINDAFGHSVGDKVLQSAARIMKSECGTEDVIARFGGDEFVIILPGTSTNDVKQMLKRIENRLANEGLGSINISISYGWGIKSKADETIADIFKVAEDHMYRRKLSESRSMHYKTIEIILKTLHEKSEREKVHSECVSKYCVAIGIELHLNDEDISELRTAGLMHDIGKIAIDLSILDKPGKLNDLEWVEIERHPELGYQILRSLNEFAKLAEYVLAHHERWDGTGYPRKLKGEEIPLEARIIAVADAYHAMTSDRPYRKALSMEVAVEEIKKKAGIQFDPNIAKLFVEKVLITLEI